MMFSARFGHSNPSKSSMGCNQYFQEPSGIGLPPGEMLWAEIIQFFGDFTDYWILSMPVIIIIMKSQRKELPFAPNGHLRES